MEKSYASLTDDEKKSFKDDLRKRTLTNFTNTTVFGLKITF